ncbi:hypothetical protein NX059_009357 [Plenodomus lindquistii]|nr:hypothetical protein NX059_009357 [Plenodomus lindquistii]
MSQSQAFIVAPRFRWMNADDTVPMELEGFYCDTCRSHVIKNGTRCKRLADGKVFTKKPTSSAPCEHCDAPSDKHAGSTKGHCYSNKAQMHLCVHCRESIMKRNYLPLPKHIVERCCREMRGRGEDIVCCKCKEIEERNRTDDTKHRTCPDTGKVYCRKCRTFGAHQLAKKK